jgi:7-cyano-7-deazaguanosine (preQ0) biosynthesis protein QueE
MRNNDLLAVNEIFGVTFQGEGKNIGMPVMFLRLAGCNQACVWCDTPYTWDWKRFDPRQEIHKMTIEQVAERLLQSPVKNLVVSGGEPMLQQDNLFHLFRLLKSKGWQNIEIETAGTIKPIYSNDLDLFTISIKLGNSGNPRSRSIQPAAIQEFVRCRSRVFKFVVGDLSDYNEIDELVKQYNLSPVYIMPKGIRAEKIQETLQAITAAALERGYHITTRMQILIHGNKRAV